MCLLDLLDMDEWDHDLDSFGALECSESEMVTVDHQDSGLCLLTDSRRQRHRKVTHLLFCDAELFEELVGDRRRS